MFIPEELELLICGSPSLDFAALEAVTSTEDGYTKEHPLIKAFWEIVHEMSLHDKKRLLFFCTGSDRFVPHATRHTPHATRHTHVCAAMESPRSMCSSDIQIRSP